MKGILLFTVASACLCGFAGCGKGPAPQAQPGAVWFTVVDKGGSAALQFGNWTLVFEAIPAKSVSVGSMGSIDYPNPAGSGGSDASLLIPTTARSSRTTFKA